MQVGLPRRALVFSQKIAATTDSGHRSSILFRHVGIHSCKAKKPQFNGFLLVGDRVENRCERGVVEGRERGSNLLQSDAVRTTPISFPGCGWLHMAKQPRQDLGTLALEGGINGSVQCEEGQAVLHASGLDTSAHPLTRRIAIQQFGGVVPARVRLLYLVYRER